MRQSFFIRLITGLAILSLCACGGGGGDASPAVATTTGTASPAAITISGIHVVGAVSETCTVTVNGAADSDPGPTTFDAQVPFSDPGMAGPLATTVTVVATDTAGNRVTSTIVVSADPATATTP